VDSIAHRHYAECGLGGRLLIVPVPNVTAHPSTVSVPSSHYLMWHSYCFWTLKGLITGLPMRLENVET